MSIYEIDALLWNSGEQAVTPAGVAVLESQPFDIGVFPEMVHPQSAAVAEGYFSAMFPDHVVRIHPNGDKRKDERATGLIVLKSLLEDPEAGVDVRPYAGRNVLQTTLVGGVVLRAFHAFDQSGKARPAMFAALAADSAGHEDELWMSDDNFTDPLPVVPGMVVRGAATAARPFAPRELTREMADQADWRYQLSRVERFGAMVRDARIAGRLAIAGFRDVAQLAAEREGGLPEPTMGSGVLAARLDRIRIKGSRVLPAGPIEVEQHGLPHAHASVRAGLTITA